MLNNFNAKDQQIRKLWLNILFIELFYDLLSSGLYASGVLEIHWPGFLEPTFKSRSFLYSWTLGMIVIPKFLFYYFSYKKHGTKLLSLAIWLFWIACIFQCFDIKSSYYSEIFKANGVWEYMDRIVSWCLSVAWLIFCYKLRAVNQRQKWLISKAEPSGLS